MRKFVQIAAFDSMDGLFTLDNEGTVWAFSFVSKRWSPIPSVPQPPPRAAVPIDRPEEVINYKAPA